MQSILLSGSLTGVRTSSPIALFWSHQINSSTGTLFEIIKAVLASLILPLEKHSTSLEDLVGLLWNNQDKLELILYLQFYV